MNNDSNLNIDLDICSKRNIELDVEGLEGTECISLPNPGGNHRIFISLVVRKRRELEWHRRKEFTHSSCRSTAPVRDGYRSSCSRIVL